ncbi:hypothetical protein C1I98_11115 [Spongiactinospora gelatinilytica]|uniref:Uncharacterized protein n=1 Tax=Spongiactinospora gelatinilytica TaxID=2666298 RepID=A0A2W2HJK8_9ACTN|nr:hypothetical protein [Spongiactinospora gelatinilytica]PZG49858.1 hypothetical protein C1I98_11115 [Spongiactinospora gelatinilytica]
MTTILKFEGKLSAAAANALEPHIRPLYDQPGATRLGVFAIRHTERTQPAVGSDKDPLVRARIIECEVANREQEPHLREVMRALWQQRTAQGTLDDAGEIQLAERTLKSAAGVLHAVEVSRLRAGLAHWVDYAARVNANGKLTVSEMHHELDIVARGLRTLLDGTPEEA